MKIKNKIHLYTSVLFIGLLIFMNMTVYFLFKNLMVESEINSTVQEMENITNGVISSLEQLPVGDLLRAYTPVDGAIQIVLADGSRPAMVTSPLEQELSSLAYKYYPNEYKEQILVTNKNYLAFSIPIIWTNGDIANLQTIFSIQTPYDQLRILKIVLISVTFIAMIPMIISSRILSTVIVKPISTMTRTMDEITKSGSFKRITLNEDSKDELHEMAHTFNHMIDLLESSFTKQEQFVSNASHELRTPLTVIESYSNLLKRRGFNDLDVAKESVEAIHSEAIRMKEMAEQLLLMAKPIEQWNLQFKVLDPKELLEAIVETYAKINERKIIYIEEESTSIKTDEAKLKQLIYIIIENALKYSDDEIRITSGNENRPFIRIIDRGIGIPQDEIHKVFDRFYRVDKARSRKYGGTGLGLALAKDISDAINVQIHIESAVGLGTSVTLFFQVENENL